MIDLGRLKALATGGEPGDIVQVDLTRRYVRQLIAELEAGRKAAESPVGDRSPKARS